MKIIIITLIFINCKVFYTEKENKKLSHDFCIEMFNNNSEVHYKSLSRETYFEKNEKGSYITNDQLIKLVNSEDINCSSSQNKIELNVTNRFFHQSYNVLGIVSSTLFVITRMAFPIIYKDEIEVRVKLKDNKSLKYDKVRILKYYSYFGPLMILFLNFYDQDEKQKVMVKDLVYNHLHEISEYLKKAELKNKPNEPSPN
jgi:hypothetical protein